MKAFITVIGHDTVGVVDRPKMLDPANVRPGDVILGLPSTGVHSNGYSLVRKLFGDSDRAELEKYDERLGASPAEVLLTPTKIYVRSILTLVAKVPVKGIAHITGGGFIENVPRRLPDFLKAFIKKGSWEVLPIFNLMQKKADIPERDMYNTFNMGIGMVVAVDEKDVDATIKAMKEAGDEAFVVGYVEAGEKGVTLC